MSTTNVDKFQVWDEINRTTDFDELKSNKKTIYFNKDNLNVLVYLNTRKDASEYLCELVKKDLCSDRVDSESLLKEIHSNIKQGNNNSNEVDVSSIMSMLTKIDEKLDNIKVVSVENTESHVEEVQQTPEKKEEQKTVVEENKEDVKYMSPLDIDASEMMDFTM